ncbi:hypothetical protein ABT174_04575, partial [Streptomyces sparsogenes]
ARWAQAVPLGSFLRDPSPGNLARLVRAATPEWPRPAPFPASRPSQPSDGPPSPPTALLAPRRPSGASGALGRASRPLARSYGRMGP